MKISLLIFFLICSFFAVIAQPGKDGSFTVSTSGHVLNHYYPIISDIAAGTSTITLMDGQLPGLCAGDLIMIYQPQGAAISTANTAGYGSVSNYNSAGLYEFKYVQSASSSMIVTQTSFTNSYQVAGHVQLIKVPQFSTLTIQVGASLIPRAWKDTTVNSTLFRFGGIVAIHAANIVNNGTVSVEGSGFRGGDVPPNANATMGITNFVSTSIYDGGEKGEGIAGFQSDYDINGGRYDRGAAANGGGGGNAHNAGGGGGANASNGNIWTGKGVMIVDANNPLSAWSLDPDYLANTNALTNSSGGGRGGYSFASYNANATVSGPGNSIWSGDYRNNVGGYGGRGLTNINAETRLYFGGGGGAGSVNNSASAPGGNGGGIVYLIATSGISGSGIIKADGSKGGSTFSCSCDGGSGGGGGGSIVIKTNLLAATQTISANGGAGGDELFIYPLYSNVYASTPDEADGPGGGGGGGLVALSSLAVIPQVNGGLNGTSLAQSITEMTDNGATAGASGQTLSVQSSFVTFTIIQPAVLSSNSPICAGSILTLSASTSGQGMGWSGPNNFSSSLQNPIIMNPAVSASGVYTLSNGPAVCLSTTSSTLNVVVNALPTLTLNGSFTICTGKTTTLVAMSNGTYSWSNGSTSSVIVVTPTNSSAYTVTVTNLSTGCHVSLTKTVTVLKCTGIEELAGVSAHVYPNPFVSELQVKTGELYQDLVAEIYNGTGALCRRAKIIASEVMIDMHDQPTGIYMFLILQADRTVQSLKIIKE